MATVKRNTKGLTPYKKGQTGNPKGRPRKLPELDKLLIGVLGEKKDGLSAAEAILRKLRQTAISGTGASNLRAAEILLDRAYGKAKQEIKHSGEIAGNVMKVQIVPPTED